MCGVAEVLLVEDDEAIGRSLGEALREARHAVGWCRDGASAIAAAESAPAPDLVILDLGLPDLDGVDVCRAVRARGGAAWPLVAVLVVLAGDIGARIRGSAVVAVVLALLAVVSVVAALLVGVLSLPVAALAGPGPGTLVAVMRLTAGIGFAALRCSGCRCRRGGLGRIVGCCGAWLRALVAGGWSGGGRGSARVRGGEGCELVSQLGQALPKRIRAVGYAAH